MNFEVFFQTLPYVAEGMCGIFAVTAVLIFCVVLLNKGTSGRKK
jgi:hypothetical protein